MAIETWRDWLHADTITCTDEDSDWPASHLDLVDFDRAFRATGTDGIEIVWNFSSPVNIRCLQIQRPNWAQATIKYGAGPTTLGTIDTVEDDHGIRRAFKAFDITTDTLRLVVSAGTPLDGAAYWSAGTVRPMGTYEALGIDGFLVPATDRTIQPGETTTLPNEAMEVTTFGAKRVAWEIQTRGAMSTDQRALQRLAFEQDLVIRPWDEDEVTMPVRCYQLDRPRTWDRGTRHSVAATLREV